MITKYFSENGKEFHSVQTCEMYESGITGVKDKLKKARLELTQVNYNDNKYIQCNDITDLMLVDLFIVAGIQYDHLHKNFEKMESQIEDREYELVKKMGDLLEFPTYMPVNPSDGKRAPHTLIIKKLKEKNKELRAEIKKNTEMSKALKSIEEEGEQTQPFVLSYNDTNTNE